MHVKKLGHEIGNHAGEKKKEITSKLIYTSPYD